MVLEPVFQKQVQNSHACRHAVSDLLEDQAALRIIGDIIRNL